MPRLACARRPAEEQQLCPIRFAWCPFGTSGPLVVSEILTELGIVRKQLQLLRLCPHKAILTKRLLPTRLAARKKLLDDWCRTPASHACSRRCGGCRAWHALHAQRLLQAMTACSLRTITPRRQLKIL
eukprot:CAMPEP_0172824834 /NCGR_PEP_ID=MMETSP1075-20121228/18269_1 /TAXON_ID=2916 /ORGANISM="Ceratium fusus, Strain PA161109" /LENGTH=127 /DNA_ID=CAMNT_0013666189 /DNA_START=553 /DNA_END=936 /DNA_ORIENTATION=-